ncbi:MAG: protein-glutamate O-methyltransferase CheR [Nitrospiraceae bacterium]|nr:protein-glutamate O-methyltransferase CheR [Nitrospiraceae bacterium]
MFDKEEIFQLSDDVFRLLRDLIKDYCGLYYDETSKSLLERRLSRRVSSNHLNDFRDYYRLLLYDRRRDEEFAYIVDILTVNETYFFREISQLKTLTDEILPELKNINKNTKKIRIWSAGCSTGEEPYSIAMMLLEQGQFYRWNIEIIGSDINQRVLQNARRGLYRNNSFRSTDEYFIKKYFTQEENMFKIKDNVKQFVDFHCLNLIDSLKAKFIGIVDVILCRNVLIYFDHESRKKVINNFHESLNENGYLILGHAESLMNISTAFTLKHFKNDMVYQKPLKAKAPLANGKNPDIELIKR